MNIEVVLVFMASPDYAGSIIRVFMPHTCMLFNFVGRAVIYFEGPGDADASQQS